MSVAGKPTNATTGGGGGGGGGGEEEEDEDDDCSDPETDVPVEDGGGGRDAARMRIGTAEYVRESVEWTIPERTREGGE